MFPHPYTQVQQPSEQPVDTTSKDSPNNDENTVIDLSREEVFAEREKKLEEREFLLIQKEQLLKEEEAEMLKTLTERETFVSLLESKMFNSTTFEGKLGKNQLIKLNVGGKKFETTLITLKRINETFFTGYFSDHFDPTPEEDGSFFIDRPFEQFHLILNYLRGIDIKQKLLYLSKQGLEEFIEEVVFYQITPIYDILPQTGRMTLISKYGVDCELLQTAEFDPNRCSSYLTLESPFRVRKSGKSGWNSHVFGKHPVKSFKVKLIANCNGLKIGFSPRSTDQNTKLSRYAGFFLSSDAQHGATLHTYLGKKVNSYYAAPFCAGCTVQCEIKGCEISYIVNGVNCGVAFSFYEESDILFPAFDVETGCVFEFVD